MVDKGSNARVMWTQILVIGAYVRGRDLDKEAVIGAAGCHAKDPFCRSEQVGKKGHHRFCRLWGQLEIASVQRDTAQREHARWQKRVSCSLPELHISGRQLLAASGGSMGRAMCTIGLTHIPPSNISNTQSCVEEMLDLFSSCT